MTRMRPRTRPRHVVIAAAGASASLHHFTGGVLRRIDGQAIAGGRRWRDAPGGPDYTAAVSICRLLCRIDRRHHVVRNGWSGIPYCAGLGDVRQS